MNSLSIDRLKHLVPLGSLRPDMLAQVASQATPQSLPRALHEVPYPWPHQVVYLLRGELKVGFASGMTKVMVGGSGTALFPLVSGSDDAIHVRAITDAELLSMDENGLDTLLAWDQLMPAETFDKAAGRASPLLGSSGLVLESFSSLPPAHIDSLLSCFERVPVGAGEVVVRQNEQGDYYYIIERGRAGVSREVAGASIEVADLKAGDAFGEEALVSNTTRNATVTMQSEGVLLRLDRADFIRLLKEPLLHQYPADEACKRVAGGAQWLDVRFPVEFRHDGLPGALNIPLNELRGALTNLPRDREYIAYCQTGKRSSAAAFLLSQKGFGAGLLAGGLKTMYRQTSQERATA